MIHKITIWKNMLDFVWQISNIILFILQDKEKI